MAVMKGKFITFEGSEGSGKSTQANLVYRYLRRLKKPVLFIREPGGVKISEMVRRILLDVKNTAMSDEAETLLYMSARAQMVAEVLEPALKAGKIVLCDRFLDSTVVYQGYGNGVNLEAIKSVGKFATRGIAPDLTLLFDIDTRQGLSRKGKVKDRIERRSLPYHNRVRRGYQKLAKENPQRIKVIKVNAGKEEIYQIVRGYVDKLLKIQ
jgi:dTMP kinase